MVPDIILGVLVYLIDTVIERRKERNRETLWVSLVAHPVKTLPAVWETCVRSLGQKDSPGGGNGYLLQYSCLENSVDRGTWRARIRGVAKSQTRPSD